MITIGAETIPTAIIELLMVTFLQSIVIVKGIGLWQQNAISVRKA